MGEEYNSDVVFRKARSQDAEALAVASKRAFDSDVLYGAPGPGGPPGYDSAVWQRKMMRVGDYYAVVLDGRVIGGMIVFRKAAREYELCRIFVDPEFHNRGVGAKAFAFLWEQYALAKRWTLGTPAWNRRTRHFYQKMGFVDISEDAHEGILFERVIV